MLPCYILWLYDYVCQMVHCFVSNNCVEVDYNWACVIQGVFNSKLSTAEKAVLFALQCPSHYKEVPVIPQII